MRDLQQRKRVSDVFPWWIVCTPTFDSIQFLVVAVRLPEPSTDNSVIVMLRSSGERRQRATGSSKGRDAQVQDTSKTPALSTSLSDHDGGCGAVGVPKPDGDADDHAGDNPPPHGAHARPSPACTKPLTPSATRPGRPACFQESASSSGMEMEMDSHGGLKVTIRPTE